MKEQSSHHAQVAIAWIQAHVIQTVASRPLLLCLQQY